MTNEPPMLLSPNAEPAKETIDPLVAAMAGRIADVINEFRRELHQRDGTWNLARGTIELALSTQTLELTIEPNGEGEEHPITVRPKPKPHISAADAYDTPLSPMEACSNYQPRPSASGSDLEEELISRKRRKLDEPGGNKKRPRVKDPMPLVTKANLDDLLAKFRHDIQEDTSECVYHVEQLLGRFKEEWHEKDDEELRTGLVQGDFRSSDVKPDKQQILSLDVIQRETKLISNQIKWLEDCRRIGADKHDKREDTWRCSSAAFHDRQRQNRESFQNRMLHESDSHAQTLNLILDEVRAIGMKLPTPNSLLTYSPPSSP